jgi:uncharacterized repeat protein (TIGR01451 family)
MKRMRLRVAVAIFELLMISSSSLMRGQASALSGTGVGIRVDGVEQAFVRDTIEYAISVYNLGDYWIRNATITDTFPNGTSSTWNITDLAPLGQSGNSFHISGIFYTIQEEDVFFGNSYYIINHAETTGYSDIRGLNTSVVAKTDFITFVLGVPVGGYSVGIKTRDTSTPTAIYTILLVVIAAVFSVSGACKQKAYPKRRPTPKDHS